MGLDTYAVVRGPGGEWEAAPDAPFRGITLMRSMGTGGRDSSSIRGKVYEEVVLEATGEGLRQALIAPAAVAAMARRLRTAVEDAKRRGTHPGVRTFGLLDEHGVPVLDEHGQLRTEHVEVAMLDVAGCEIEAAEAEDLARWLEVCADHGYALAGSW